MLIKYSTCLRQLGFSLVELMIAVTLLGVLSSLAFPTIGSILQNAKTRTAAEVLQNGLRLAQSESVKRGRRVQFVLTEASPPQMNSVASASGKNWLIQELDLTMPVDPKVEPTVTAFIQGASIASPTGAVAIAASSSTISFSSIGRLAEPAASVLYQVTNTKGTRRYNITVSVGGGIRMCDPDKVRDASTPDGC